MGTNSVVAVVVAWLALLEIRALCQCPELTESILEGLTVDLIVDEQSEGGAIPNSVNFSNFKVNCLAAASTRGYLQATVTVNYTADTGVTGAGQMFVRCPSANWIFVQSLTLPRTIGNTTVTAEQLLFSETDASCRNCQPAQSKTDVSSYCLACSDECDAGLTQCYLDFSSTTEKCCNFYDVDDNCVAECGINQVPSENYTCLCSGFFEPQKDCTVCNINASTCTHGSPVLETCSCNCTGTGYSGPHCDQDVDECTQDNSTCSHNGDCTNTVGSFICDCTPGYSGMTCDQNIDDCADQPCKNGATCHDGVDSHSCECAPGFSGDDCVVNVDECEPGPCGNGGTCVDGNDTFDCVCPIAFSGPTCEEEVDECASQPCANEGVCIDGHGDFSCRCVGSWRGKTCEECFIENCVSPVCDGDQAFCRECGSRFSLVGDAMCVSCSISNCASCSSDDVCSQCVDGYELIADDLCSLPPEPLLSGGELIGLLVGLFVLLLFVAIAVTVTLLYLKKHNWYKPAKKDPGKEDKDIILSKITKI